MTHRLVDLSVTEISLCRQGLNPGARILLVKGTDAGPDPVAAAVAKAVAAKEAEIAALKAERERHDRLAKAARWSAIGIDPAAYAEHAGQVPPATCGWFDAIFDRAAAALAEADLYGERGRAAVHKAESAIVRRARAARG